MIRIVTLILLVAFGCTSDGSAPPFGDPSTIAYSHCGPAPLQVTWTIGVDNAGTPDDTSDDLVELDALEYAKVEDFHVRALDWMHCTLAAYRDEHGAVQP